MKKFEVYDKGWELNETHFEFEVGDEISYNDYNVKFEIVKRTDSDVWVRFRTCKEFEIIRKCQINSVSGEDSDNNYCVCEYFNIQTDLCREPLLILAVWVEE